MKQNYAIFAGGCFWCVVESFKDLEGVIDVLSGFTGGEIENPTYEQVCTGSTGHFEAVKVIYDEDMVSYTQLLKTFVQQIDPTDAGGQFYDRGPHYRTAIFYNSKTQRGLAEKFRLDLSKTDIYDKPIAIMILPAAEFYAAEQEHQDYYKKCPVMYKQYKKGSGRKDFIDEHSFEDMPKAKKEANILISEYELEKKLTKIQYDVTKNAETELPYSNKYWNNNEEGIYVDVITGEVLFSSKEKFDSSCGWPSFTKTISKKIVKEKTDKSFGMIRTEIIANGSKAHLGHVFEDGPGDNGLRYCINSASLRFIKKDDMQEQGYGEYLELLK